jgi:hypothetical protein
LTPLPAALFLGTYEETRLVSWDCLISFAGSRYSVPWAYAGQPVWVRSSQGVRLQVRSQHGEVIATHALAAVKGSTVIDPTHYEGLAPRLPKTRALATAAFRTRFPEHEWFLEGLYAQHVPNGTAHLRAILGLAELYSGDALRDAFTAARQYQAFSHAFIRGVLEGGGAALRPASSGPAAPSSLQADLGIYQARLEGR